MSKGICLVENIVKLEPKDIIERPVHVLNMYLHNRLELDGEKIKSRLELDWKWTGSCLEVD